MKKAKFTANWIAQVTLILGLCLSGCSMQWREADPGIDDKDLIELIANIGKNASVSSGSGNLQKFMTMAEDNRTSIYFAEGFVDNSGPMGPPAAILSFLDFGFMGQAEHNVFDMDNARAIFLDMKDDAGVRQNALLIDYQMQGQSNFFTKVFLSDGNGEVDSGLFIADLYDDSSNTGLRVESLDVLDGSNDLAGVIQLQVYDFDQSGENYLGKIPTLVGFD